MSRIAPVAAEGAAAAATTATPAATSRQQRVPRTYRTSGLEAPTGADAATQGHGTAQGDPWRRRFYWDVDADEVTFASGNNNDDSTSSGSSRDVKVSSSDRMFASAEFTQIAEREAEAPPPLPILGEIVERHVAMGGSSASSRSSHRCDVCKQLPFPKAVHRTMQRKQRRRPQASSSEAAQWAAPPEATSIAAGDATARATAAVAAEAAQAAKALGADLDEVEYAVHELKTKLEPDKFAFLQRRAQQKLQQQLQQQKHEAQQRQQQEQQLQQRRQQEEQQQHQQQQPESGEDSFVRYHIELQRASSVAASPIDANAPEVAAAAEASCRTSFTFDSREAAKLRWTDPLPPEDSAGASAAAAAAALAELQEERKQHQFAAAAGVPLVQGTVQQQQLALLRFDFNGRLRTDTLGLHAAAAAVVSFWQHLLLPTQPSSANATTAGAAAAAAEEAGVGEWLTASDAAVVSTAAAASAAADADPLASYKGLHHHGLQPEAAGYTLEEAVLLAHSAAPSQRALAVRTLGQLLLASRALCLIPRFEPAALPLASTPASMAENNTEGFAEFAALRQQLSPLLMPQQQLLLRGGFGIGSQRFLRYLVLDQQLPFRLCGALMADAAPVPFAAAAGLANWWLPTHATRRVGPLHEHSALQQLQQEEQAAPDSAAVAAIHFSPAHMRLCCAVASCFRKAQAQKEAATAVKQQAVAAGAAAGGSVCSCNFDLSDSVAAAEEPSLFPLGGLDLFDCTDTSPCPWPAGGGAAAADGRVCLGPGSAWAALAARWKNITLQDQQQQSQQQHRDCLDLPLGESFGRHSHAAAIDFAQLLPRVAALLRRCSGIREEEQQLLRLLCGLCAGGSQQVQQLLQQPELRKQILVLADGLLLGGDVRQRRRSARSTQLLGAVRPLVSSSGGDNSGCSTSSSSGGGVSEGQLDEYALEEQRLLLQLLLLLRICVIHVDSTQKLESLFGPLELICGSCVGVSDSSSGNNNSSNSSSIWGLLLQSLMTVVKLPKLQCMGLQERESQQQQCRQQASDAELMLLPTSSVLHIAAAAAAARVLRLLQQRGSSLVPLQPLLPAFAAHVSRFVKHLQQVQGHLLLQQLSEAGRPQASAALGNQPQGCSFCMLWGPSDGSDSNTNNSTRKIAAKARQLLRFEGDLVVQLLLWAGDTVNAESLEASLLMPVAEELLTALQRQHLPHLQQLEPAACSRLASAAMRVLSRCTHAVSCRLRGSGDGDEAGAEAAAACDDPAAALAAAAAAESKGETAKASLVRRWCSAMTRPLRLLLGLPVSENGGGRNFECNSSFCKESERGQWEAALERVLLVLVGQQQSLRSALETGACFARSAAPSAEAAEAAGAAAAASKRAAGALCGYLAETGWTLATRCCALQRQSVSSSSSEASEGSSDSECWSNGCACSCWVLPVTSENFAAASAIALQAARVAAAASVPFVAAADATAADIAVDETCVSRLHDPRMTEMLFFDLELLRSLCGVFSGCLALLSELSLETANSCEGSNGSRGHVNLKVLVQEAEHLLPLLSVQKLASQAKTLLHGLLLLLESLHEQLRLPQHQQQRQEQPQPQCLQQQRDLTPFTHSAVQSTASTIPQERIAACALAAWDLLIACSNYIKASHRECSGSPDNAHHQHEQPDNPHHQQEQQEYQQGPSEQPQSVLPLRCAAAALANAATPMTALQAFGLIALHLPQQRCWCSSRNTSGFSASWCVWGAAAETVVGCSSATPWDLHSVKQLHLALGAAVRSCEQHQTAGMIPLSIDIIHKLWKQKQEQEVLNTILSAALFVSALDMVAGAPLWVAILRNAEDALTAVQSRAAAAATQHLQRMLCCSSSLCFTLSRLAGHGYLLGGVLRCLQLQQPQQHQKQGEQQQEQQQQQHCRPLVGPSYGGALTASGVLQREWRLFELLLLQPLGLACVASLAATADAAARTVDKHLAAAFAVECKNAASWRAALRAAGGACAAAEGTAAPAAAAQAEGFSQSVQWLRSAALAAASEHREADAYACCCESARSFAARGALQLLRQLQASATSEPQQLLLLLLLGSKLLPREARIHIWADEGALTILDRNSVVLCHTAAALAAPAAAAAPAANSDLAKICSDTWEAVLRFSSCTQWGMRTPQNDWVLTSSAASNCVLLSLLSPSTKVFEDDPVVRLQRSHQKRQLAVEGGLAFTAAVAALDDE
ncbi:hypothetical protein ACSSS7_001830 [Eimeria intestinalis]